MKDLETKRWDIVKRLFQSYFWDTLYSFPQDCFNKFEQQGKQSQLQDSVFAQFWLQVVLVQETVKQAKDRRENK